MTHLKNRAGMPTLFSSRRRRIAAFLAPHSNFSVPRSERAESNQRRQKGTSFAAMRRGRERRGHLPSLLPSPAIDSADREREGRSRSLRFLAPTLLIFVVGSLKARSRREPNDRPHSPSFLPLSPFPLRTNLRVRKCGGDQRGDDFAVSHFRLPLRRFVLSFLPFCAFRPHFVLFWIKIPFDSLWCVGLKNS